MHPPSLCIVIFLTPVRRRIQPAASRPRNLLKTEWNCPKSPTQIHSQVWYKTLPDHINVTLLSQTALSLYNHMKQLENTETLPPARLCHLQIKMEWGAREWETREKNMQGKGRAVTASGLASRWARAGVTACLVTAKQRVSARAASCLLESSRNNSMHETSEGYCIKREADTFLDHCWSSTCSSVTPHMHSDVILNLVYIQYNLYTHTWDNHSCVYQRGNKFGGRKFKLKFEYLQYLWNNYKNTVWSYLAGSSKYKKQQL